MKYIRIRRSTRIAMAVATLGGGAVLLAAAGPAAAESTPPVVQSFTVTGPATVDTTYSWAGPTVRLRITDAGSGVDPLETSVKATYARAASAHPASTPSGTTSGTGGLTRVSGTAADGIYEALIAADGGTRGTWSLAITATDVDGNRTTLTTAQIAASGWTSTFKSETTKVPAPMKITSEVIYPWWGYNHIGATIHFNYPAGTPTANGAIRVSANAACGTPSAYGPLSSSDSFLDKKFLEKCILVYRAVNAAGVSAEAAHSFR